LLHVGGHNFALMFLSPTTQFADAQLTPILLSSLNYTFGICWQDLYNITCECKSVLHCN